MKHCLLLFLVVTLLVCSTGCFRSSGDETSQPATPSVTTTTAPAVTTTTTLAVVSGGNLSQFPCTAYATDSLNVRRDASTDYEAVGGLHEGEQVTVLGKEGDFYKIQFNWSAEDGQSGSTAYVSAMYISATLGTKPVPTVSTTLPTVGTATAAQ